MEQNRFWRRAGMRAGLAFGAAMGGGLVADGHKMDPMMSALIRFVRRITISGGCGRSMRRRSG